MASNESPVDSVPAMHDFPAYLAQLNQYFSEASYVDLQTHLQSAVQSLFQQLPVQKIEDFVGAARLVTCPPLLECLLATLQHQISQGRWGALQEVLACLCELLRSDPYCPVLCSLTGECLRVQPPSVWRREIADVFFNSPEQLTWWTSMIYSIPNSEDFAYVQCVKSFLHEVKTGILTKTLKISQFKAIRRLASEQLTAFIDLLRADHYNESEEVLHEALEKAYHCLDELIANLSQVSGIVYNRRADISVAVQEIEAEFRTHFDEKPLSAGLPSELYQVLEAYSQHTQVRDWLERVFRRHSAEVALPVTVADFMHYAQPRWMLSERSELVHYQRQMLRLSFPQALLQVALTGEESDRLVECWYHFHSLTFSAYMQNVCFDACGTLIAAFTRDLREDPVEVQEVAQIRIQASTLTSGSDLQNSLKVFLRDVSLRLYVLDYCLTSPHSLDVSQVKAAFEKETAEAQEKGKVLCLLIRLPPSRPVIQGPWSSK